jgi:predicted RNA-binding Zn-ribbon protein involved in translation (DUF1610 family)
LCSAFAKGKPALRIEEIGLMLKSNIDVLFVRSALMKNSRKCPKCQSSEIVRVPPLPYSTFVIPIGFLRYFRAEVTRYLCASCGFFEHYVESATDIAKVKQKYGTAPG